MISNQPNIWKKWSDGRCKGLLPLLLVVMASGLFHLASAQGKSFRSGSQKKSTSHIGKAKVKVPVTKAAQSPRVVKVRKVVPTAVIMPFLGPRYARVAIRDRKLAGAVYYLVSGHGGPDPGAIGHYGRQLLAEDEYAYDVTARLAYALAEHGAKVYMIVIDPNDGIRDDAVLKLDHDEVTYPNQKIPLSQKLRLRQGTDAINKLHRKYKGAYQRMVTIHVDSRSEGQNIDVFFYHHQTSKSGRQLATHIHRSFKSGYKRSQPNRTYLGNVSERSSLYVVRNSNAPTVFIELGNIRNAKDQQRFLRAGNRQALANWICAGLQTDFRTR